MLLLQHSEEHQDDGWDRPTNVYGRQNLLRIVVGKSVTLSRECRHIHRHRESGVGKSVTLSRTVDSTILHILLEHLVNEFGPLDAYVATP